MHLTVYILALAAGLFFLELIYFKIAVHFSILDKPNQRSSHKSVTIRGGGVIFSVAAILSFFLDHSQYPYFIMGLFLIALISFMDDMHTLGSRIRLFFHLISVGALIWQLQLDAVPFYILVFVAIFIIGIINAYNFMDGINGMTGLTSIVTIGTLYYINLYRISFAPVELLTSTGISLVVFNYFNFRVQAKCFAGDVGSVSMAFIIVFLLGRLIVITGNYGYILLLLIYGLDTATTIFFRVIKRENIVEAHRSHFYQYLVNERRIPHRYVAAGYATAQLLINILLLNSCAISPICFIIILLTASLTFLGLRFYLEGSARLLNEAAKKHENN